MKRTSPLRLNYEFKRVYRKGCYHNSKDLTLYVRPRRDQRLFLGVTVSRKVKGSVRRNRVKRWLRELYRLSEPRIRGGFELIILGRTDPEQTDFASLTQQWNRLLERAELLVQAGEKPDRHFGPQCKEARA